MIGWLFPAPSERRLLPETRGRPMPWVIAIMMFVTLVVAAAGLAIANAAARVGAGADNRYSVQIPGGASFGPRATAVLRSDPAIRSVRPVAEATVRALLESWLGKDAAQADLPIPVLIDVDLAPGADAGLVCRRLRQQVPEASFTAYREQLAPLARSLQALQWLALALVVLMGMATSAAVVLAARSALDANRGTIEVLHGIGATDDQVSRLFQRRIALDALAGGLGGGILAGLVLLLVLGTAAGLMGDFAGGTLLRPRDMLLLALLPVAGAILATAIARRAVLGALRAAL
ncbi:cell division protein FtsX [Sphingomonas sp. GCM10030256]|uniref:cell division protein FtsX n=1 Tax=Sphingomonas sp. GCM10030256 TaxID=3273427 RepID=UPI0036103929